MTDTIGNKRRVSQVISHELSHQWFGNLVSLSLFKFSFTNCNIKTNLLILGNNEGNILLRF